MARPGETSKAEPVAQLRLVSPPTENLTALDPTLRANPSPEVTDLFCRLPLPTLF
jgi:hypothetical protein